MQSRGDSVWYSQAALLASEQCKGSCWLWPQLVMKTLFSFLFQTMPPVWANCREPKRFTRCNKLNPVHSVNNQAHYSQCSPRSFYFLGGDKGTETVSEIRIRFRAPEWLCYSSLVPEQGRCWCSKELLHETIMYSLSSCSQDMPTPLVNLCLIQSIPWLKLTAFQKAEDPSTVSRSRHQMAYLASRLPHWEAIQWAWWVSQEKFIASLCNWKMHFWFSVQLKLKFQLNKL